MRKLIYGMNLTLDGYIARELYRQLNHSMTLPPAP